MNIYKILNRFLTCVPLLCLFVLSFSFPVHARVISIEQKTSPVELKNVGSSSLFSGDAQYAYPMVVVPGTHGVQPEVKLSYSSSNIKNPMDEAGLGWGLNKMYIERDVRNTPSSFGDDRYTLVFNDASYELTSLQDVGGGVYRAFNKPADDLHIEYRVTGGTNEGQAYWMVKTKDGTTYRLGYTDPAEAICNYRQGWGEGNYGWRWFVDQVTDVNGNTITYTYEEIGKVSRLSEITYNQDQTRAVKFNYQGRLHQPKKVVQGCVTDINWLLDSVDVKLDGSVVRSYDLSYQEQSDKRSLLTSIVEKGSDGTALPATQFTYNQYQAAWSTTQPEWLNTNSNPSLDLSRDDVRLMDVNNDALPDIVTDDTDGAYEVFKVYKNTGSAWSATPEVWFHKNDDRVTFGNSGFTMADVNGDSLPDMVLSEVTGSTTRWWVAMNVNGERWEDNFNIWADGMPDTKIVVGNPQTTLADMTGDGKADIVFCHKYTQGSEERFQYRVFINNGGNWPTSYTNWFDGNNKLNLDDVNVQLSDVNGDGLVDIVGSIKNLSTNNIEWKVALNNGSRTIETANWLTIGGQEYRFENQEITLSDANGDGFLDIIRGYMYDGPKYKWEVFLNDGKSWLAQNQIWLDANSTDNVAFNLADRKVAMADVDGDGMVDLVGSKNVDPGTFRVWHVAKNVGMWVSLMSSTTNPNGGKTNFDYGSSVSFDNTGADSTADLPFVLPMVKKITQVNGMTGDHAWQAVTNYSYKDGFYNYADQDFMGFGQVTVTTEKSVSTTWFHQDAVHKGKEYKTEIANLSGALYQRLEKTWAAVTRNGISVSLLAKVIESVFDGAAQSPRVNETNYEYDNYNNVTKVSALGDVSVSSDNVTTVTEYTYNPGAWIVQTPNKSSVKAADGTTLVDETVWFYDNHPYTTDSPEKGLVTQKVRWSNVGDDVETLYEYDSRGNLIKETDARGHATQYQYGVTDQTFTFAEKEINAKNQVKSFGYDRRTGNVLSQTDANGNVTSFGYDVFGRKVKEIRPYDSAVFPTLEYSYQQTGTAPSWVKTTQRTVSGTSQGLVRYAIEDGFGLEIQTRGDAEDVTKQIVTDTFYNESGLMSKQSIGHLDTKTVGYVAPVAGVSSSQKIYDTVGRLIKTTNPDGTFFTIAYDRGTVTQTDENGHVTVNKLDVYNNIVRVEERNGTDTYVTTYTYTPKNELKTITDHAGNIVQFTYDSLGRKSGMLDPNLGVWSYIYDQVGNLGYQSDANGKTVIQTYDELNRVLAIDYPTDTDVSYVYDRETKGTLSEVGDANGVTTYIYDQRLRQVSEKQTFGGTSWITQKTYDAADRVVNSTDPGGTMTNYTYNSQGQVESVPGVISNVNYNAVNKITKKDYVNGLATTFSYSPQSLRLLAIQVPNLQDAQYTYDSVGNITKIQDTLNAIQKDYSYDDLDRLTRATKTGSGAYDFQYVYNAIGNLMKIIQGTLEIPFTYGQSVKPHAVATADFGVAGCPVDQFKAEYFNNKTLSGTPVVSRCETVINNDWGGGSPVAGVNVDSFSVRWTKQQAFEGADYKFTATADDGVRVYVGTTLLIDKWIDQGATTYTATKTMTAGDHAIKVEYYENGGGAVAKYSSEKVVVTPPPPPSNAYGGEYFDNKTLTGTPKVTRSDVSIDFDWGGGSPHTLIPVDNFSARWTKTTTFAAGSYEFTATGDDGIRLFVDGVKILDKWIDQGSTTYKVTKDLTQGNHTIVYEYYENGGGAVAKLSYLQLTVTPPPANVLFQDDFNDGNANGWMPTIGTWSVVTDGTPRYQNIAGGGDTVTLNGNTAWLNYKVESKIKLTGDNPNKSFGVIARYRDNDNYYLFHYSGPSSAFRILKKRAGTWTTLVTGSNFVMNMNTDYLLKAELQGSTLKLYVDGVLHATVSDSIFSGGKIGLRNFNATVRFDDVVVTN